jgi:uncharacterized protein YgiB involved in biofilm formation
VFFDAAACAASGAYSLADCREWEREARAEFDEKAPKFDTRSLCERTYAHCMIGEIFAGGGVAFVPRPRGFAVPSGPQGRARPVLEGGASRDGTERRSMPPQAPAAAAAQDAARTFPVPPKILQDIQERARRFGHGADE